MQQRQLRLGDILDDYCPRERRVTNHAVVAMVGPDVKQTRCTTCDAEHDYKHAKVPRQRRKSEPAALYSQVAAGAPKRVRHDTQQPVEDKDLAATDMPLDPADASEKVPDGLTADEQPFALESESSGESDEESPDDSPADDDEVGEGDGEREQGPVHRPLIRASLPRPEGQPPPTRPLPEFTVRQPGARPPNRFRLRHQHQRGAQPFQGNRSGGGPVRGGGGMSRPGGNRPPQAAIPSRPGRRHGSGRKRSK